MRDNAPNPNPSNRRDFLRGSGMAAATAVISHSAQVGVEEASAELLAAQESAVQSGAVKVTLQVNGKPMATEIEPRSTLLDVLRHRLDVTGPKRVCDRASCGACTVLVDGQAVYGCTTLAISAQGKQIRTLESFDTGEKSVAHAFHENDAMMCGYCTPGFVTACQALLEKNPNPTLEEVRKGLDGNICRCGTYVGVVKAALEAAKAIKV